MSNRQLVTAIIPPIFEAQIFGVYRIDLGIRVIKAYRHDGSVMYRALRSLLPSDFNALQFSEMVEAIRANSERIA